MQHLIEKLKELQERDFKVGVSRGSLSLQQTQRNKAKAEILDALYKDLKETLEEEGYNVYITSYGPVIELLNPQVEDKVIKLDEEEICTGRISIQIDTIMKNLDTDPEFDQANHLHELEQKELRQKEAEKKKRDKVKRDAEIRAEKARKREEREAMLEKLARDKKEKEDK